MKKDPTKLMNESADAISSSPKKSKPAKTHSKMDMALNKAMESPEQELQDNEAGEPQEGMPAVEHHLDKAHAAMHAMKSKHDGKPGAGA